MFKKVLPVALLSGSALLTGCASSFGIGNSEYGCSGYPEGVQCMSAKDMYQLTEQPGSVTADKAIEYQRKIGKMPPDSKASDSNHGSEAEEHGGARSSGVAQGHILSQSPINDGAVPIRTRSEIMRIWVAPWESADGDLHISGLVFTELEQRRWNIGVSYEKGPVEIKPLSTGKTTQSAD